MLQSCPEYYYLQCRYRPGNYYLQVLENACIVHGAGKSAHGTDVCEMQTSAIITHEQKQKIHGKVCHCYTPCRRPRQSRRLRLNGRPAGRRGVRSPVWCGVVWCDDRWPAPRISYMKTTTRHMSIPKDRPSLNKQQKGSEASKSNPRTKGTYEMYVHGRNTSR